MHRRTTRAVGYSPLPLLSALVVAAMAFSLLQPVRASADELADLRAENLRLRAEVERLRTEVDSLRAAPARATTGGAVDQRGARSGGTVERIFVPRSRVSLATTRDAEGGGTTIATPWYQTAEGGPLPRKEWLQFRARRQEDGSIAGVWMVLDRRTGRGSLESVEQGSLIVDGRRIACTVDDYDVSRRQQAMRNSGSTQREERVRFVLPDDALALLASAARARFIAGASEFELDDEQLTGAAALAARVLDKAPREAGTAGEAAP